MKNHDSSSSRSHAVSEDSRHARARRTPRHARSRRPIASFSTSRICSSRSDLAVICLFPNKARLYSASTPTLTSHSCTSRPSHSCLKTLLLAQPGECATTPKAVVRNLQRGRRTDARVQLKQNPAMRGSNPCACEAADTKPTRQSR